ncbi:CBS domain-containing protein [uncultured Ramlibacter sp.]|uniref:CBS domain-containing protein n=1 Tax=uncultured Ramlibacter sp. TaxID=260755 RepID=UPI00262CA184|nr:CBS domain-containing protein [uncultured Ramlibacter sp.]
MNGYTALATRPFLGMARLCMPDASAAQVTMDSPATVVMTDLTQVAAVVTQPQAGMEAAHETMVQRGVRMLLVLDAQGRVAGLLSASDILGEKPMHLVHERRIRHADILVADVMTAAARLDAFEFKSVQAARVGNVVARLVEAGRQHALVTQPDAAGQSLVRGIFSLSQIARQLGLPLQLPEAASSFAEIEAALVAH